MTAKQSFQWDTIDNLIGVDINDDTRLDIVSPERTYLMRQTSATTHKYHIWKCCYLKRRKDFFKTYNNVIKLSFCPKRAALITQIIHQRARFGSSFTYKIQGVFNRLDEAQLGDKLYTKTEALKTYHKLSEILFAETQGSAIRGKKKGATNHRHIQTALRMILSIASGVPEQTLKDSAINILITAKQKHPQKPSRDTADMQALKDLHQRHFESCAFFLLEGHSEPPLYVKLKDLGYEDYYCYGNVDSYSISNMGKRDPRYSACFGPGGDWDARELSVRKRHWKSLGLTYDGQYVGNLKARTLKHIPEGFLKLVHRRTALHFTALLLLQSGANTEVLPSIDFEAPLSADLKHKRIPAIKPRTGYDNKPIRFSAQFAKSWKLYTKVRSLTIATYAPDFGRWGIPLVLSRHNIVSQLNAVRFASNNLGLPPEIQRLKAFDGRHFKTTNLLEKSNGNLALISAMIGRSDTVTRRHYAYNAFNDSASALTQFWTALHEAVTIKAQNYSPRVVILNGGVRTHTGRCEAKNGEEPIRIEGVTLFAPEPRCRAPATCFFCGHYALHATESDIKLLLACREWLHVQTKVISRDDREHFVKFVPIIERIDDIIADFRTISDTYDDIFRAAEVAILQGDYPPYWRNKLDALIESQEVL